MDNPSMSEFKNAIDRVGSLFETYKQVNDERVKAVETGQTARANELDTKLQRIETDLTKATKLKEQFDTEMKVHRDRIEELEAKLNLPGRATSQEPSEHLKDFRSWMRGQARSEPDSTLAQKMYEHTKREHKDVLGGTGSAGGFAVPEEISREIGRLEMLYSPVRRIVKVVRVGTPDYKELITIDSTTTSGWAAETTTRGASSTPTLRERAPTFGELYAYPQASEHSLDDIFFNVDEWLTGSVARQFALALGTAVITGSGTNRPTGMLNTTPTTDDDDASPLRSEEAYEYIACVNSPAALDGDCLIDLVYALNPAYRPRANWIMNSATTGTVRKLKDQNDQYLWAPGLQPGQPSMLLGYPVETWEQLSDVGTNNFPIAFGDFREGYILADRTGLRITRDPFTTPGYVKFYIRQRVGGIVRNNDAIKWLRTTQV